MTTSIFTTDTHAMPLAPGARFYDSVRWPAVIAGIFGTLSMLAVLTVLGVAVGLSAVDQDSNARNFGIGAGVWGSIAALLSFAFGGWLAARSSDPRARGNGILQGAMVWMVSLGLLTYLLGSGLGSVATTTVGQRAAGESALSRANIDSPMGRAAVTPDGTATTADPQRVADRGSKAAWGTLTALLLGLGASLAGGYFGARRNEPVEDHTEPATPIGRAAITG